MNKRFAWETIVKHGPDVFTRQTVGVYQTKQETNAAEQAAIFAFNAYVWDGGYNLTFGEDGSPWSCSFIRDQRKVEQGCMEQTAYVC
jgi:hypothetical protein